MRKKKSVYTPKKGKYKKSLAGGWFWHWAGLAAMVGGFLLLLAWGVYSWGSHSPFFQLETIRVHGNKKFNDAEIVAMADLNIRSNLMAVKKKSLKEKLLATGWIRDVQVEKNWPGTLIITVKERQPLAMVKAGKRPLLYMDRYGRGFARVTENEDLDFPVISLADEKMLEERAALKDVLSLLRYAARGNMGLPKQNISQIVLAENGEVTLYLADNPFPIYMGQGKMWQKYKHLARVLNWLYKKRKFMAVREIDMGYLKDRVLVKFS